MKALTEAVRVMTYNIRHGQGEDGWVSSARIARVVRESAPDIVGMNEVWQLGTFYDQPARLAEALGHDVVFGGNTGPGSWRQGNLVLTRGRIVRWENLALPGGLERRGCLVAEIELDGTRTIFASTHLSLRRSARETQIETLARELPHDLPLVLAGDMNCSAEELEPLRVRFALAPPVASYPAFWPLRALDHVAFSVHWRVEDVRAVRTKASDHLPVLAQLARI